VPLRGKLLAHDEVKNTSAAAAELYFSALAATAGPRQMRKPIKLKFLEKLFDIGEARPVSVTLAVSEPIKKILKS